MLTIDDKTIGRQLASGENADKIEINFQCESMVQAEGRKFGSYADNRQDADAQKAV